MPTQSDNTVSKGDPAAPLTGKWITPPGEKPANYTFLARKRFDVSHVPGRALLRITADSRYVVYLNGQRIGQGPARGTGERYLVDSYDVVPILRRGSNVLAAWVHCPVIPLTSAVPPAAPALIAQIDGLVETDATWEVCADPSRRADAILYNHHIGYSDYRDLREELVGWRTSSGGADTWPDAQELTPAGGRALTPRGILALTDDRYRPSHVVKTGAVPAHGENIESDVEYAALMQNEEHAEAEGSRFQDVDALTWGRTASVLPSEDGQGAYVILDFGRALVGSVILDIEAPAGAIADVGLGEAVEDGRVPTQQVNINGTVYRYADRYILRSGRQRIENRLHDRGLRFVQLVLRRFSEPIRIHSVEVENRVYPMPLRATFECDQPFLNRLWHMSCDTMRACCMDLFVDCPWREQTLWLDDHYQENLYYLNLTADPVFPAHNLRISSEGVLPNGLFPGRYPSMQACNLPCTSANWVMVLHDYYTYTGDLSLVRELLPVMDRALDVYESWRDDDGLVPDQKGDGLWNFIDWGYELGKVQLGGKTAPLNMLIAAAFKLGASLHQALGSDRRAQDLRTKSSEMAQAIGRQFWLPDEQRFDDCTEPSDGRRTFSQIPHAIGLHFDLLAANQRDAALTALLDPALIQAELGYQQLVLSALVRHGRAADALRIIRTLWGKMVRSNSPTLWEIADGRPPNKGNASLCHGYASAPIQFMQTALLGVEPLEPGFRLFSLRPQSLGVLWAKGQVPTPNGSVHVSWSAREDGALLVDVDVPGGTTGVLSNGEQLHAGRHHLCETRSCLG